MIATALFAALANATCGAYAVTLDQKIVFWNRAAEGILGFRSEEVVGRHCYEVVRTRAEEFASTQCSNGCPSIRYLRAGLVPLASQLHLVCSSGERKWIDVKPMVVTGVYADAPLLVHLFEEGHRVDAPDSGSHALRDAIVASGADILSDGPSPSPVQTTGTSLTKRELEVLRLMALGRDTPSIAVELDISRHTVRNHIRNLRQKLKAGTKLDAVVKGIRLGILPLERHLT